MTSYADRWVGSTLRRVLVSARIAGLREHNGEVVGDAAWPAIIDRATHDRLVGLLDDPSRRRENFGRPVCTRESQPVHPAHLGIAEESGDTGEEKGDEDSTAILSAKG